MTDPQPVEIVSSYGINSRQVTAPTSGYATVQTLLNYSASIPARSVVLLADSANTDTLLVGDQGPNFPLTAGTFVSLDLVMVDQIAVAVLNGTAGQILHILFGGR
jgi:hypothetical protein